MNEAIFNRVLRARIQIQLKNPFFSFMSLFIKPIENNDIQTMGVNVKGEMLYNADWVGDLSDEELQGVITHEICHLVFQHLTRLGERDKEIWNYANDFAVNYILKVNGYDLPSGLVPDSDGNYNENGLKLEKIGEKTSEIIYDEIIKQIPQVSVSFRKNLKTGQFDTHIYSEGLTDKEKKEIEKEWEDKIQEAMTMAQMKGDIPKGMERFLENLHKEQVDWRTLLNQMITREIPYNQDYSFPHKKSKSMGFYIPHDLKEKIKIAICVDLSGNIGEKEYADFMSEVIGIARAYQERCDIHFYSHDVEGYYGGLVRNGNIEEIRKIKLKGGGGTSHKKCMDMVGDKNQEIKLAVFFTDGYSDLNEIDFKKYNYRKLFIINKDGTDEQLKGKDCKVIKLK